MKNRSGGGANQFPGGVSSAEVQRLFTAHCYINNAGGTISLMLATFKTINYRGGVVRFRIPSDWLEEYEDAGGGTFYKPGEKTGTLRVNVTTGEGTPEKLLTVDNLAELLTSAPENYGATPTRVGENAVIYRYEMPGEERGQSLTIRCWGILQALPPKNFRHVLFTYTLLADQASDPACMAEMDILDREIEAAQLSPRVGRLM